MSRILFSASAAFCAALATPAFAQAAEEESPALTVSGSATLVSQYRFRGISLSDENAGVQAVINLNHESGFYVGAAGYSTDGFGELGGSNLELDLYGGYRREVAEGVTIDGGLLYYAYPGSTGGDFEFFEPYANVTAAIGPATAKVGVAFAPAQDALADNSNIYLFGDLSAAVPGVPVTLTGHLGWSKGDTPLTPGGDYIDWSLGAATTWRNLTLGVSYVGTDIGDGAALAAGATPDIVDDAIVFSLSAAF